MAETTKTKKPTTSKATTKTVAKPAAKATVTKKVATSTKAKAPVKKTVSSSVSRTTVKTVAKAKSTSVKPRATTKRVVKPSIAPVQAVEDFGAQDVVSTANVEAPVSSVAPDVVEVAPVEVTPVPANTVLYEAPIENPNVIESTQVEHNTIKAQDVKVKTHNKSGIMNKLVWAMLVVALCLFIAAATLLIITVVKDKKDDNQGGGSSSIVDTGSSGGTDDPVEPITYTSELKSTIGSAFNSLFDVNTSSLDDKDVLKKQLIGVLPSALEYAQVPIAVAEDIVEFLPTITTTLDSINVDWDKLLGFEGEQQIADFLDEIIKAKDYEKILKLVQDFFKTGITTDQASKMLYKVISSQSSVIIDNSYMLSQALLDMQERTEDAGDVASSMQYLVLGLIFDIAPGAVQSFIDNADNEAIIENTLKELCDFVQGFANAYFDSGISEFLELIEGVIKGEVNGEALKDAADKVYKAIDSLKDKESGKYIEISNKFKAKINSSILYINSLVQIASNAMSDEQKEIVNYYVGIFNKFLKSINSVDTFFNGAIDFVAKFFQGFTKEINIIVVGGQTEKTTVAEAFANNLTNPDVRIVDPSDESSYYFQPNLDTIIILSNLLEGSLTQAKATFSESFFNTIISLTTVIPGSDENMIEQVNAMIDNTQMILNLVATFSKKIINIPLGADINDPEYAQYLSCQIVVKEMVDHDEDPSTPDVEQEFEITMSYETFETIIEDYLNSILASALPAGTGSIKDIIIVPTAFIMVAAMTPSTVVLYAVTQPIILLLNNYAGLELDAGVFDIQNMLENYYAKYSTVISDWLDDMLEGTTRQAG